MAPPPEDPPHGRDDESPPDDPRFELPPQPPGASQPPPPQQPPKPPGAPGAPGAPAWPGAPGSFGAGEEDVNDAPAAGERPPPRRPRAIQGSRYGWAIGVIGVIFLIGVTINTVLTTPNGAAGLRPGEKVPAFAAPLVHGGEELPADVATRRNEHGLKEVPACQERGAGVLNICELYERGPVVLALFTDKASCPDVLTTMQALAPSFPGVSFAAVAIKNKRPELKKLVEQRHLTLPVGFDEEGTLAPLYKLATCPQLSFIDRGGRVQSKALLVAPTRERLRARVTALVAASDAGATQR